MTDPSSSPKTGRRVSVRFAAGANGLAHSSVWHLWTGKNNPDLYLMVGGMSEIKASVHCPRPDKPTWKRHFGFDYTAKGELSNAVKATGESRHKASWSGASIGHGRSIEWRIFIRGTSLLRVPQPTSSNVRLIPSPPTDETLIFTISIGAPNQLFEFPQAVDAQTSLLQEGKLVDGRQFWVTYCYVPIFNPPVPANKAPRQICSPTAKITPGDTLRILTPHPNDDGSLAFFEWRVEMTENTVQQA